MFESYYSSFFPTGGTKEAYTAKSSRYSDFGVPQRSSLCCFLILDLEVSELIRVLAGGNDSEELLQLLLLKVLLGQVLEVSLGERNLGLDDNRVHVHGHSDGVSEVSGSSLDLDSLGKELLEVLKDNDVVLDGELAVNGVLKVDLLLVLFVGNNSLGHFVLFKIIMIINLTINTTVL